MTVDREREETQAVQRGVADRRHAPTAESDRARPGADGRKRDQEAERIAAAQAIRRRPHHDVAPADLDGDAGSGLARHGMAELHIELHLVTTLLPVPGEPVDIALDLRSGHVHVFECTTRRPRVNAARCRTWQDGRSWPTHRARAAACCRTGPKYYWPLPYRLLPWGNPHAPAPDDPRQRARPDDLGEGERRGPLNRAAREAAGAAAASPESIGRVRSRAGAPRGGATRCQGARRPRAETGDPICATSASIRRRGCCVHDGHPFTQRLRQGCAR